MAEVLGDPILLQRLLKNALDNAARHAGSIVNVALEPREGSAEILVENDGESITDEAIAGFGQRRKNRFQPGEHARGASLGLGSVIMRTIAGLHGGSLEIGRRPGGGTRLRIILPGDRGVASS